MMQVVDLTRPHGYLVWKGKQRSIVSPTPLPVGDVLITSDGEVFGIATLSQPSQVSLSEFERESTKHCMRPEERLELWPTIESFYLHDIKAWKGFGEPWLIVQPDSQVTIENNKGLLKTIIIHPDANGSMEDMSVTLEATFNCVKHEGNKALPFYELRLAGEPILRFEDVKKKEAAMPYEINEEECVINTETGEVEKCHESHEEAMAHMAALNINVEEKAVTKTEGGESFSRSAYLFTPSDNVSEWKLRIEVTPGQVTKSQLGAAAAALSSGGFRGQQVSLSDDEKKTVAKRLIGEYRKLNIEDDDIPDHLWPTAGMKPSKKAGRRMAGSMMDKLRMAMQAMQELMMWGEYHEEEPEEEMMMDLMKGQSGTAFKMVNGEPWHLSWSSNSFQDRDEEIFSLKSLEQYVAENSENEVKGWFNLWHIKGTDFAEKRFQAIVGKFLFEAGPYLKDSKGQAALKFFKQYSTSHPEIAPEGWGASVEYKYLPEERKSKVYQWTWITRTSTLARGAAANVWTKSTQETTMNDEQRKASEAIFGKEFTDSLVAQGQQKTKELEEAGVANKAVETVEVKEAEAIDPNQLMNELATKMQTSLNEALVPVLTEFQQQIVAQGEQLKALAEEIKALKKDEAVKAAVEMPRFTFQALRASQSASTVVPEGDALKDKKPQEAKPLNTGSLVQNYFPNAKG